MEYEKLKRIDDYLSNKLVDQEMIDFEEKLRNDPSLQAEVKIQKQVNNVIIENRFFNVIDSIEASGNIGGQKVVSSTAKTIIGVVTSTVVVAVAAYFYMNKPSENKVTVTTTQPVQEIKTSPADHTSADSQVTVNETKKEETIKPKEEELPKNLLLKEGEGKKQEPIAAKANKPVKEEEKKTSHKEEEDGTFMVEIPLDHQETSIFNPEKNHSWTIPVEGESDAVFKVKDKAGKEVYHVKIINGIPFEWKGITNNGSLLEAGNYSYVIEYPDGQSDRGNITIQRGK